MNKFLVSGHLGAGAENGLLLRELEALTGLDSREVRRQIQRERLAGTPILSDCKYGYYLAASEEEIAQFTESMRRRAGEILRVARAVEEGEVIKYQH